MRFASTIHYVDQMCVHVQLVWPSVIVVQLWDLQLSSTTGRNKVQKVHRSIHKLDTS